jgi:hypothetical protein
VGETPKGLPLAPSRKCANFCGPVGRVTLKDLKELKDARVLRFCEAP